MNDREALKFAKEVKSYAELEDTREMLTVCISALNERIERDNPVALTVEELRERVGKPMWCEMQPDYYKCGVIGEKRVSEDEKRLVIGFSYGWEWIEDIVRRGKIYDYPPKGAETEDGNDNH